MNFKSLKVQILFYSSIFSGFLLSLFGFVLYYMLEQNILTKLESSLHEKTIFIASNIDKSNILEDPSLRNYEITILKDRKATKTKGDLQQAEITSLLESKEPFLIREDEEYFTVYYLLNFDSDLSIIISQKNIPNKAENLEEALMLLIPILLLLLLFLINKVIDQVLKPIKNITSIANEITVGDFSKTIEEPKAYDELKNLVNAFNTMRKRLKFGFQTIEQFNHDVSHELKTPLTVIKGEVEVTLDRQRDIDTYIKSLQTIEEEATHIETIINELLLLTKYTKENIKDSFEFCSVDTILQKTIQQLSKTAGEKNITLHVKQMMPIICEANALLLERIFVNLLDNAIKYSPEDKDINISLYQDKKIHFILQDEGIGISQDKLQFITERFYRVDSSRNKTIKGYGLGLSIVKSAIELHEGILDITSTQGVGTTVHVTL